jgi:hypothetical protein
MSQGFTGSALVIALSLAFASTASADTRTNHLKGKLAVPVTGSVVSVGGGTFAGTLVLQRFAVRNGTPVAIGAISGSVQTDAGSLTGIHALIELPVTVSGAASPGLPGIQRQRGNALDSPTIRFVQATCGVARVEIGNTNVDLLGLTVHLNPVLLELNGDSAGVLGNLVCQVLELANNVVGLVGVLNAILGLLGGLLGGLGGAIPV